MSGYLNAHTDQTERQAYLNGQIAATIIGNIENCLLGPPVLNTTDFLASK
jgi:hypothetical protein